MRYSEILGDILDRKNSKCVCGVEYLAELKPTTLKRPDTRGSCNFGPNCQFEKAVCNFDQLKCTCYQNCTCGLEPIQRNSDRKPQICAEKLPGKTCTEPDCICVETCLCKSRESLLMKSPPICNKAVCKCEFCTCRPHESYPNLLPSYFRSDIKQVSSKFASEELVKRECAEIKQLLKEHEESTKKEADKAQKIDQEKTKKAEPDKPNKGSDIKEVRIQMNEENSHKPSMPGSVERSLIHNTSGSDRKIKSIKKSNPAAKVDHFKKKSNSGTRKEKSVKKKQPKTVYSSKTRATSCYCRRPLVKRPVRITYYYSGNIEHYGVKLGHQKCLSKTVSVPKHMGWLWNIEDPSKGIRERKGWPPGFIAKNIKNMMKVMKRATEGDVMGQLSRNDLKGNWNTIMFEEEDLTPREEPPLLHIHRKGRTTNITFCPRESDESMEPQPIPFSITEKKRDSDGTTSSDSTLEFEFHSPKPQGDVKRKKLRAVPPPSKKQSLVSTLAPPPSSAKAKKKNIKKKKSMGSEENKNLWEEQQTQIQNID